jgi:hypothetical protein
LEQINIDGAAADFLPHCWRVLVDSAPDGSLNSRLLLTVKSRYGGDRQREIDDLIVAWQQYCLAEMMAVATAVATAVPPPLPVPATATSGRPALFLSYAGRDLAVAERQIANPRFPYANSPPVARNYLNFVPIRAQTIKI